MNIVTWFDHHTLTSVVPDSCVIIGGTRLVAEFFSHLNERQQDGQLAVSVPFINPNLVCDLSTFQGLSHRRIECSIVTSARPTSAAACRRLLHLPWKSLEIYYSKTLHAKTYAFAGRDGFATMLIGSHNLTFAGTQRNTEIGVLMVSRLSTEISDATERCIEYIKTMGRHGKTLYDSSTWPEGLLPRTTE